LFDVIGIKMVMRQEFNCFYLTIMKITKQKS